MSTGTFMPACHGVMDKDVVGRPYVSKTLVCCRTFNLSSDFIILCTCLNSDFYCSYIKNSTWCLPAISQSVTQDSVSKAKG